MEDVILEGGVSTRPTRDRLLTAEQVCDILGIGRTKLWQMRRSGDLDTVYLGGCVRFRASDVEQLMLEGAA